MPSQQRLEGPDLEELLDQVRSEYGDDASIIEANKIRKGGVGGFFARELFEVVVELDDAAPAPAPAGPPARGILDLVDAVEDGPARGVVDLEDGPLASPATVEALLARTAGEPLPDEPPAPADGIAALLARMSDRKPEPAPRSPTSPTVSTDGDAFGRILERIASANDPAPVTRPSTIDDDDDEPFRPYGMVDPTRAREAARATSVDGRDVAVRDLPAPEASPVAPVVRAEEATPAATAAPAIAEPLAVTPRGLRAPETPAATVSTVVEDAELELLGIPAAYRSGVAAPDRLGALVSIAEQFPSARPLPDTGGTVIALVGDRASMQRAIDWIQRSLGLAPETLMLASPSNGGVFPEDRRISTAIDAETSRQGWRRRPRPVLVVVDQPVSIQDTAWTRHVLDALEPQAVWGVVDATRKAEDVSCWAERIGGVDAIAVGDTAETSSPASILTTGIPVALIDGATANPSRWAAVLGERLAA